jgi:hypothetical protein
MPFDTNVFVNCPFDEKYRDLIRPMLFTLIYHGLQPRLATERMESGEQRITKIIGLIKESKFAIHDLSRIKAKKAGEMFRLNMPFELGIDVGCKQFGGEPFNDKRHLVLASERYEYQQAISDISGSDILAHKNEPEEIVKQVRAWLAHQIGSQYGPQLIWNAFTDCMGAMFDHFEPKGFSRADLDVLSIPELMAYMQTWIGQHKLSKDLSAAAAKQHTKRSNDFAVGVKPTQASAPVAKRVRRTPPASWKVA